MSCHFVKYGNMDSSTTFVRSRDLFEEQRLSSCSIFRRHFNLGCHGRVSDVRTIIRWVSSFSLTAYACNRKPGWSKRKVRTPAMIENVRAAVARSPKRSARRHSAALNISDRSLRRILHKHLHYHPYKL